MVEDSEYFKMLKRMIKAGAKRAGKGDEIELEEFYNVMEFFKEQFTEAVNMQIEEGKSWTDIGNALNITRMGAYKRFKKPVKTTAKQ